MLIEGGLLRHHASWLAHRHLQTEAHRCTRSASGATARSTCIGEVVHLSFTHLKVLGFRGAF